MHYHNLERARAHLKEQTGITFRDHEGKRGRDAATRSYPPKRISRKVRDVVHHIQRFPSFYRDSSATPLSFFLSPSRSRRGESTTKAAFVYLTQFVDAFSSSCAMNQDFLEYFLEYPMVSRPVLSRQTFTVEGGESF